MLPRISLITPSFQQADYLDECLRSVHQQGYPAVEHIVVDGGSTDGSKAIIEAHAQELAWWCCEKDKGQSDAINKGLTHATGEVFGWLNSDDALKPGALQRVGEAFASDPDLLVFGGQLTHMDERSEHLFEKLNGTDDKQLFRDPVINQPATFYRMSAVRAIGGVDPALRYVMDVELWWQLLFRFGTSRLRFVSVELAMFRLHDGSKTVSSHAGFLDEIASLLHRMCLSSNNAPLAHVLGLGHAIRTDLRGVPVDTSHHTIVKGMAVHFLLKWHGLVHTKAQYRMMRSLRREVDMLGMDFLDRSTAERWKQLDQDVLTPTWLTYRLRRKWRHLRS